MQPLSPITPRLFRRQSTLPGPHQPVNSYLLETATGKVLIDPAADFPRREGIERIFVTHVQEEHIAGAANFPDAALLVPAGDEYLCDGRDAYEKLITRWPEPWDWETRGNFRGHLAGARNERPPESKLPVAGVLRDGDEIGGLKVLATPGHGKNAVTLLTEVEGKKFAFCGDLICGDGRLWNWFDADWDYGLQLGHKALLASAKRLLDAAPDVLLPAHGEPIFEAGAALQRLIARLEKVLREEPYNSAPLNFPDKDGPAPGWRELSPHLFQWKTGNAALLVSRDGSGLLVDDGLCHWVPLPERAAHHRAVMAEIKAAFHLSQIEFVIPTHYHGDHTENIPALVEEESTRVVALDVVAEPMQHPERYNLAAALWWYDAGNDTVPVHQIVRSGERFTWHEYELEIFHLGGQTFYHCGIAATIDGARVLFAGDAIYGRNPACEAILCYNDCEPSARGWAYAVERMIERSPDLLVCGHGSAVQGPMPLLLEKRERWRKRLAEFDELNARETRRAFFDPFL
jgi:glyoxylase-like metal-dependent hydrolase (beta-lactamase superfamily II)